MKIFLSLCLIGLFDGLHCLPTQLFVNSQCHNDGVEGICKLQPDCLKAEEDVKTYGYHNLTRCGFDNFTEIVCCLVAPNLRSLNITSNKIEEACTNYTNVRYTLEPQIANGKNATPGEFPYMAALGLYSTKYKQFRFSCGGTLISDKYVVTAAHCILNLDEDQLRAVRLGTVDVPPFTGVLNPNTDYTVKKFTIHPNFRRRNNFNDIALVELEKPVQFGAYLRPACLFTKRNNYPDEYVITGWGSMDTNGRRSNILQKAAVSFVSHEQCRERYKRYNRTLQDSQMCAVHATSDTCKGDSGGPLLKKDSPIPVLVGITTHGAPGCGTGIPSVYASVSNYVTWIERIVWP